MKKKVILGLILLLGLVLRIYNLDFPSVGYHNMKENEYFSMAEEMTRTKDFITRRVYFYNAFEENPTMKIYPQLPLISYQTLISWKLLGNNLWGPRLFNVFFGIAGILVIYLIADLLFQRTTYALLCAFLLAIMPLAVFFSRNLQPESPAFLFMLLGNFLYLKFIKSPKRAYLFWGGLSFSIAWLYKFSFVFGALPIMFCFPFKDMYKAKKGFFKDILTFLSPYLLILISILWLKWMGQWEFQELDRINPFEIFSSVYWEKYGPVIWWYISGENYSLIFTLLALLGIVSAFIGSALVNSYIIAWTFTIIPYSMIFSDYINQHNYYQMPFLGLVCVSSVYAISFVSQAIKRYFKRDFLAGVIIFIIAVSVMPVYQAVSRMHKTVFLGGDVAGKSLREFTGPDERIFLFTHCQGYGIARYAQRYAGWPSTLEDFKEKEEKFKIRYICIYPAGYLGLLNKESPLLFSYIQDNYHPKEFGISENQLIYLILEKGKAKNAKDALQPFSEPMQLSAIYRLFGKDILFYTIRPDIQQN